MADTDGYSPIIDESELEEGKMKLVRVEGKPVLFIKQNGKIFVIDDRCPHMGCKFSGGSLRGVWLFVLVMNGNSIWRPANMMKIVRMFW